MSCDKTIILNIVNKRNCLYNNIMDVKVSLKYVPSWNLRYLWTRWSSRERITFLLSAFHTENFHFRTNITFLNKSRHLNCPIGISMNHNWQSSRPSPLNRVKLQVSRKTNESNIFVFSRGNKAQWKDTKRHFYL